MSEDISVKVEQPENVVLQVNPDEQNEQNQARSLVRKTTIDAIEPIEGADRIEVAKIRGWRVVVGKGEFQVGEQVLFFEVDSALNPFDSRYEFLKERCYKEFKLNGKVFDACLRIKTIKLRGVYSQGLILKPDQFYEVRNARLEEDCTRLLNVRHYDTVAEKAVRLTEKQKPGNMKGLFPWFCLKSDEERVQNLEDELIERKKDVPLEVTEKVDGSSCSIFFTISKRPEDPFGVCSRNYELKQDGGGVFWQMAVENNLPETLPKYCQEHNINICIQGEICGPGVNGNHDLLDKLSFRVFRIWDIDKQEFLTPESRYQICKDLNLEHVPVLGVKTLNDFDCDRDKILQFAEGYTASGHEREGVVFKSMEGNFHFKAVSNRYLMTIK